MDEQMETPIRKPVLRQQPRLVLMGEFSAGKSTLSNMLLGSRPLPMPALLLLTGCFALGAMRRRNA